jgi:hypothetical protein
VDVFVDMPEVLTLGERDPHVVIIDAGDDSWAEDVVSRLQRLG